VVDIAMTVPEIGGRSRDAILARIRAALGDVPAGDADSPEINRRYRSTSTERQEQLVDRFARRVSEYKARVTMAAASTIHQAIREAAGRHQVARVVAPLDLPPEWLGDWAGVVRDGPGTLLSTAELAQFDAAITGCAAAIAETGTIVLNGDHAQGRRAISLLPDVHICVVFADQICGTVPEAIQRLRERVVEDRKPVTFISGPSATSDIELNRVEGVHGPRVLEVIVVS
jgi:L-lactate dehydrogenase complex protein LldG